MRLSPLPPLEIVREWLNYDPETGNITWRKEPSVAIGYRLNRASAGHRRPTGYVYISVPGYRIFAAHRLAWLLATGTDPGAEVDHIDGNASNNAITNLRLATSSQQKMNRGVQSNNRSGLKGAYYHAAHHGKKWRSQIKVGPKLIFLGYFHTAEEAHAAYAKAAVEHHGEFARVA